MLTPGSPRPGRQVTWSPTVRDNFAAEVVRLSPRELKELHLRGSGNLGRVTVSPPAACPSLELIDLNSCNSLHTVFVQSNSVKAINLARCPSLKKLIIQAPCLETLNLSGCESLESFIMWGDAIKSLDFSSASELTLLKLYCPNLEDCKGTAQRPVQVLEREMPSVCDEVAHEMLAEIAPNAEVQRIFTGDTFTVPQTFRV